VAVGKQRSPAGRSRAPRHLGGAGRHLSLTCCSAARVTCALPLRRPHPPPRPWPRSTSHSASEAVRACSDSGERRITHARGSNYASDRGRRSCDNVLWILARRRDGRERREREARDAQTLRVDTETTLRRLVRRDTGRGREEGRGEKPRSHARRARRSSSRSSLPATTGCARFDAASLAAIPLHLLHSIQSSPVHAARELQWRIRRAGDHAETPPHKKGESEREGKPSAVVAAHARAFVCWVRCSGAV
jgi:hypothetical protein